MVKPVGAYKQEVWRIECEDAINKAGYLKPTPPSYTDENGVVIEFVTESNYLNEVQKYESAINSKMYELFLKSDYIQLLNLPESDWTSLTGITLKEGESLLEYEYLSRFDYELYEIAFGLNHFVKSEMRDMFRVSKQVSSGVFTPLEKCHLPAKYNINPNIYTSQLYRELDALSQWGASLDDVNRWLNDEFPPAMKELILRFSEAKSQIEKHSYYAADTHHQSQKR